VDEEGEKRVSETRKSHHLTSRRLKVIGAAAGIALAATAALSQPAFAQDNGGSGLPAITPAMAQYVLAHKANVPANAVRATSKLPTAGSKGSAFQVPVSPRSGAASRIVGGTLADPAAFPSVVGIESIFLAADDSGVVSWWIATCTGTVLSSTKVLTAGHCTAQLPFGTTVVIAGRSNLDDDASGGYVARVASTWIDQQMNLVTMNNGGVPQHDVAVLTLKDALPSAYTPVTLSAAGDNAPYAANTSATIVGYGVTTSTGSDSGILRQATVNIQADSTCSSAMPGYDAQTMTCAGTPAGGVDSCFGDSGGPIMVNGAQVGITDWGSTQCAAAGTYGVYERLSYYHDSVTAEIGRRPIVNLDWSGDGHTDLLGRTTTGDLIEYSGSGLLNDGYNGFAGSGKIGNAWNAFSKLFRVTNWNGDGNESIMAETSGGTLYEYNQDGLGDFTDSALVGTGWNMFSDIMVTNNWTGSGAPNLMGRTPTGDLYLYESDGHGGWKNNGVGIKIGTGWNMFNTVLTPGDWRGKGQALIGRTPAGDLRLYESDGKGGWINSMGEKIGNGWNMFSIFFSPGDWNGDNLQDMLGITPAGALRLYTSDGAGNWLNPLGTQIGSGWNGLSAVF
jgi:Trypsin